MSIAASDSIGGAGIQADNRTASLLGVYPVNVVTAVTAQNSSGVFLTQKVSPEMIVRQFECICEDFLPDCVKIGLLPSVETVDIIATLLVKYKLKNIVIDPVLQPTRGEFYSDYGIDSHIINKLSKTAVLITPNLPEFEVLNRAAGQDIRKIFHAVLVKGGHSVSDYCVDTLYLEDGGTDKGIQFKEKRIDTQNSHGTGCVLSSAIACNLAMGYDLVTSVKNAKEFLHNHLIRNKELSFGKSNYGPAIY